jgi:hypothetical protein
VERLRKVFAELGENPTDQHCNGMEGVVIRSKEVPKRDEDVTHLVKPLLVVLHAFT